MSGVRHIAYASPMVGSAIGLRIVGYLLSKAAASQNLELDIGPELLQDIHGDLRDLCRRALVDSALPWELALAVRSLVQAPNVVEQDNPTCGAELRIALTSFIENPSLEQKLLPNPETFFLFRDRAAEQIAAFLSALLVTRGIDTLPVRESLMKAGAATVADGVLSVDPVSRSLLDGLTRILRASEARSDLHVDVESISTALEEANTLKSMSVTAGGRFRLSITDGRLTVLRETSPDQAIPAFAEAIAQEYRQARGTRALPSAPMTRFYVEPTLRRFDDDVPTAAISAHVENWLAFAPRVPLVLIGDPGSGKTMACRWLIERQLQRAETTNFSPREPFPLYVPLRSIRQYCASLKTQLPGARGQSLLEICLDRIDTLRRARLSRLPRDRRFVVILDGFDELALLDNETTIAVLDAVGRLAEQENIDILLTGRTLALAQYWSGLDEHAIDDNRWLRAKILPFSLGPLGSAREFCQRYLANDVAGKTPDRLLELADLGSPFSEIAQTPVLLAMLCDRYSPQRIQSIAAAGEVSRYRVLDWLVDEAIKWRANPHSTERIPISADEAAARMTQYGQWAWAAVKGGGTDFSVSTSGAPAAGDSLVEFFFQPSDEQPGRAAFVHRTLAEYMASRYLVEAALDTTSPGAGGERFLRSCQELASGDRPLDANLKKMFAEAIKARSPEQRHRLCGTFSELLFHAFKRPDLLRWNTVETRTLSVFGLLAELCFAGVLAATGGQVDSDLLEIALVLRMWSPRSHALWQLDDAPQSVVGAELGRAALPGFNFTASRLELVRASQAAFTNTTFTLAQATSCFFAGAEFIDCNFDSAVFVDCDFSRARFRGCSFSGAWFVGCHWSSAAMVNCGGSNIRVSIDPVASKIFGVRDIIWTDDSGRGWSWDGEVSYEMLAGEIRRLVQVGDKAVAARIVGLLTIGTRHQEPHRSVSISVDGYGSYTFDADWRDHAQVTIPADAFRPSVVDGINAVMSEIAISLEQMTKETMFARTAAGWEEARARATRQR